MKTRALIIQSDKEGSNKELKYKNPKILVREKTLGELKSDKIRVEMLYVGICGSDTHVLKTDPITGTILSSVPLDIPEQGRIIGHEGVGKIIEVGKNVDWLKTGMYVTLESIQVCNTCDVCRRGSFNQCRHAKLVGLEVDGVMSEVVDIDATLAHNITDIAKNNKNLIEMACIEPICVASEACDNAEIQVGDRVVIFGAGPIGLYTAMICKVLLGVSQIHIVEPIEFRRNIAKKWTTNIYKDIEDLKHSLDKVDVIIEASGNLENIDKSFEKLDANGRIVLLARSGENLTINNVDYMITNNIKIIGSRGHLGGHFKKILRMYREGVIDIKSSITSVVNGIDNAKLLLEKGDIESSNCKVVVKISKDKEKFE